MNHEKAQAELIIASSIATCLPVFRQNYLAELDGLKEGHFANPLYGSIFAAFVNSGDISALVTDGDVIKFEANATHVGHLRFYANIVRGGN